MFRWVIWTEGARLSAIAHRQWFIPESIRGGGYSRAGSRGRDPSQKPVARRRVSPYRADERVSEGSSENLCQLVGLEQNGICFHTICPLRFLDQLPDMFVSNPKRA
jgi:hypothetical protein